MSSPQQFPVPAPGKGAWATLVVLSLLVPLATIGTVLWAGSPGTAENRWVLIGVMAFALAVTAALAAAMSRRRVELAGGVLTVRATVYTRRVAIAALDLEQARTLDLRERSEWRPLLKTNGFSLPGLRAGHFRLRSREPAFVLYTDPARVLLLPVSGDKPLLLGVERPQALLQALRTRQARAA